MPIKWVFTKFFDFTYIGVAICQFTTISFPFWIILFPVVCITGQHRFHLSVNSFCPKWTRKIFKKSLLTHIPTFFSVYNCINCLMLEPLSRKCNALSSLRFDLFFSWKIYNFQRPYSNIVRSCIYQQEWNGESLGGA